MKPLRVIFAGGGTGGHLFPALALADKLKQRSSSNLPPEILFCGTKRGLEFRMKEKLGYPLELINVRGMARRLTLVNLLVPFLLVGAIAKSMLIIARFHPDIVIGSGGYVMGPVLIAAIIMGKRRVIQEQNSFPGVTTRKLAGMVDRVFLGFGEASKYLPAKAKMVETGNPIKEVIGTIPPEEGRKYFGIQPGKRVILILGGSQGATAINRNIMRHIDKLPEDIHLIWQTGERDYKEVAASAGGKVPGRSLFAFTDRIEYGYAAADLVIARAGALTLAEIIAAGLPSLLVPYPHAAGDHQRKNALPMEREGASIIIEDRQLQEKNLLEEAVNIFKSGRYDGMKTAVVSLRARRTRPAADLIVDEIMTLLNIS